MVSVGDRVRVTGILPDDPDPLEVGDVGTVLMVTEGTYAQIIVDWDSGRRLALLPTDPYEFLS
jgi:hypothetical protein